MESEGTRWATDLGMQDYESLESKGMSIFGRTQDAQRWSIFRLNNYSHSTLTVNNQLQLVKGYAKIDQFSDRPEMMYAISDLSTVYEGQLTSARRGVAIVDQKFVAIRDELKAPNQPTTVRWAMLTTATPELKDNSIVLTKEGHSLTLQVNSPTKVVLKTWSTDPTTTYDAPNPGKILVGFEIQLAANQKQDVQVLLIPGSVDAKNVKFEKALGNW